MKVHIPPTMSDDCRCQTPQEQITHVDHVEHRIAWKYVSLPRWILDATRWQWLTAQDGKIKYESLEVFKGIAAYPTKWLYYGGLMQGVGEMGRCLKERAESQ